MLVLSLLAAQLSPGKIVDAFMHIGPMAQVHTSQAKVVNKMKTLNKMLPLHLHPYLYPYAKLVFTYLLSLPFTCLF